MLLSFQSEQQEDLDRLEWLLQRGVCFRGHRQYDKDWQEGGWLDSTCNPDWRREIDKARDFFAAAEKPA